jgi:hypothetical protein
LSAAPSLVRHAGWDSADFNVMPADGKTEPFTFAILFLWTKIDGVWMCKGDFAADIGHCPSRVSFGVRI